jgi:hypothetical protein
VWARRLSVVLQLVLSVSLVSTVSPSAGVAYVEVNSLNVCLPVTSQAKALTTVLTLIGFNLLVNSLDVYSEVTLHGKLHTTLGTLVMLFFQVNNLVMCHHATLAGKPPPTLIALVLDTLVSRPLVLQHFRRPRVAFATSFNIALEWFYFRMHGAVLRQYPLI